jgi:hypothetical protein
LSIRGIPLVLRKLAFTSRISKADSKPKCELKLKGSELCLALKVNKNKDVPVTGPGDLQVCETSRTRHFLIDNHSGVVVRLRRRPRFNPRKIPGTHFCLTPSAAQGHSAAVRIR